MDLIFGLNIWTQAQKLAFRIGGGLVLSKIWLENGTTLASLQIPYLNLGPLCKHFGFKSLLSTNRLAQIGVSIVLDYSINTPKQCLDHLRATPLSILTQIPQYHMTTWGGEGLNTPISQYWITIIWGWNMILNIMGLWGNFGTFVM